MKPFHAENLKAMQFGIREAGELVVMDKGGGVFWATTEPVSTQTVNTAGGKSADNSTSLMVVPEHVRALNVRTGIHLTHYPQGPGTPGIRYRVGDIKKTPSYWLLSCGPPDGQGGTISNLGA